MADAPCFATPCLPDVFTKVFERCPARLFVLNLLWNVMKSLSQFWGSGIWRQSESVPSGIVTHVWLKSKLCPLLWGQSYPNTFPWFCFYFLQRSWDSGEFGMLRGRQGFDLRSEDQAAISKFYLPERFFSLSTATLHPVPIHPETLMCA